MLHNLVYPSGFASMSRVYVMQLDAVVSRRPIDCPLFSIIYPSSVVVRNFVDTRAARNAKEIPISFRSAKARLSKNFSNR